MGSRLRTALVPLAVLAISLSGVAAVSATPAHVPIPVNPPLSAAPITNRIALISTSVTPAAGAPAGYTYRFYRDYAYPCSIPDPNDPRIGYFTFVLATRTTASDTVSAPLWVKMHGGGVGYFDIDHQPQPNRNNLDEESAADLEGRFDDGLMAHVSQDRPGAQPFRFLIVSMCNRDLYAGGGAPDPNNPYPYPTNTGSARPASGLFATKAAITWTLQHFPTDHYFLHGGSSGSYGTFGVAWAMQLQGSPPSGVVADSGVLNQEAETARIKQHTCGSSAPPDDRAAQVYARLHPKLTDLGNEPDKIVADGRLTVPIMQVWDTNDPNTCGATPMRCPLHDGTFATEGAAVCAHLPLRNAILALPAARHSEDLQLCVTVRASAPCGKHVVTGEDHLSTVEPYDYNTYIYQWALDRLNDG